MQRFATTDDLSAAGLELFDTIIDVRSPSEFADDHLPGAINLPVLDDEERARIGTEYAQVSPFEARRHGAALTARNIARHIETALGDKPKSWRPLVYCWRGGMRSTSMALVLSQVGWRVTLLEGGYKTWRRSVVAGLESDETALPIILVDGQTGTGKTAILHELARRGEQVLDLEGLAGHRGSAFGDFADLEQPSQKAFETGIWPILRDLDPQRPLFVEAESSLVGRRRVPVRIWQAMKQAPRIVVEAPVEARADFLMRAYPDLIEHHDKLLASLDRLKQMHSKERIAEWRSLAERGDYRQLAVELVTEHYDPAYSRARKRHIETSRIETVGSRTLDEAGIEDLATQVIEAAGRIAVRG